MKPTPARTRVGYLALPVGDERLEHRGADVPSADALDDVEKPAHTRARRSGRQYVVTDTHNAYAAIGSQEPVPAGSRNSRSSQKPV